MGRKKKFKLKVETREEWKVKLAGRGQRYGSAGTRYEVRGSPAEMTPANQVVRTLDSGLVPVLSCSWQRCRRHATKGPGSRGRPRATSTWTWQHWPFGRPLWPSDSAGAADGQVWGGLGGIATWSAPALKTLIDS